MAAIGKAHFRASAWRNTRSCLASSSSSSSSFATSSARRLPPPPAAVSSNASTIMADEAQLGRHFYLNKALEHWASRSSTKMTLRQLLFFGRSLGRDPEKILKSANYVREELPIRIAQRIRDMQDLPFVVMTNEHLEKVYQLYWRAFDRFRRWPVIVTHEDNARFVALLKELLEEHLTVIPSLALGVVEVSEHLPAGQLEGFMQRMLRSRISRRVLAEQHIALSEALDDPFAFFSPDPTPSQPETIGIIHTHLSVRSIINESISLLQTVFAREAGLSLDEAIRTKAVPEMVVDGDLDARISYIPEHLSFVVFELIKDAMRAVMRFKPEERDDIPLRATIVEGPPEDDLIIRISDCGGGVSDLVSRLAAGRASAAASTARATAQQPAMPLASDGSAMPTMPATTIGKEQGAVASSFTTTSPLAASSPAAGGHVFGANLNDSTTLDQPPPSWPVGAVSPVRSSGVSSSLTDVLCSFSNVKRRLELEEEARRAEVQMERALRGRENGGEGAPINDETAAQAVASSAAANGPSSPSGSTTSTLLGASAQAGLGSRSKLELLRRIGKFKGTVSEQVGSTAGAPAAQSSANSKSSSSSPPASTSEEHHELQSSLSSTSLGLADTGLGMAMARVYAEYFGGSLNFRSLDGHGMDVYYRVSKMGKTREGVEDVGED